MSASADSETGRTRIDDLCERLVLEPLDRDLFLADPGSGEGRLFGGLVAAQSVLAAIATLDREAAPGSSQDGSLDDRPGSVLHSIHAYFLRPGRYDVPIRFVVDRIRDGRTFTTRRVVAHQSGEAIFNMAASFARPEEGMSHQSPMPDAPAPEGLEEWTTIRHREMGLPAPRRFDSPIEVRAVAPDLSELGQPSNGATQVWIRPRGVLPDDPDLHTAALVYATDRTLLGTAARAAGFIPGKDVIGASLDHAVWLHRPIRFDDWLLYASQSPASHAARGLIFGSIYGRDGIQLASVAQEALLRAPKPKARKNQD